MITPEEYGAKGDGVTDDTKAVNNALIAGVGGEVKFSPNKTYSLTSLEIPSDSTITAYGTTFKLIDNGLTTVNLLNEGIILRPGVYLNGKKNIKIYGMKVDGNRNADAVRAYYRHCFYIYDSEDIWLEDCEGFNCEGFAFGTCSSGTHTIDDPYNADLPTKRITFKNCKGHDTWLNSTRKPFVFEIARAEYVNLINCEGQLGQESIFRTHRANHIHFSGCTAKNVQAGYIGECYDIFKSADVTIDGKCYAESLAADGGNGSCYFLYDNVDLALKDCTALGVTALRVKPALGTESVYNYDIQDNTFNGDVAVYVNHGDNLKIINNAITSGKGAITSEPHPDGGVCDFTNMILSPNTINGKEI